MSVQKYRYSKKAGALNEVAFPLDVPPAQSLSPGPAQAPSPTQIMPPAMFRNIAGEAVTSAGIPVGMPGAHAQYVDESMVDPHAGRLIPPTDRKAAPRAPDTGLDPISSRPQRSGMFFYTVEEGQRVRMIYPDGTVEILVGPRRVWKGRRRFAPMAHYVAHPGEFLIVRFRDGRQEHHPGPAHVWFDPAEHLEITREDALQLSAKEAVVVYSEDGETGQVSRRIVYGPAAFVPKPGEWLHTFSWHGSRGGHAGYQKVPNALVFQKLWLMPDQMYHDVLDVRTADDAVLTIRLMIFFELANIEKMLDTTHDPIGDFVNAATSDVVDFTGRYDFESFKQNTDKLNDLATYRQLTARAEQCGYRIDKVVYRGYGAPESLQRMHNEAIESRTRLQLERATQQQAQDLEDFTLERKLRRAERQRAEEEARVSQELEMARRRAEAKRARIEAEQEMQRAQRMRDAEQELQIARKRDEQQRAHLEALREMGVDLTKFLTQGRADRVIELRGAVGNAHLHLNSEEEARG